MHIIAESHTSSSTCTFAYWFQFALVLTNQNILLIRTIMSFTSGDPSGSGTTSNIGWLASGQRSHSSIAILIGLTHVRTCRTCSSNEGAGGIVSMNSETENIPEVRKDHNFVFANYKCFLASPFWHGMVWCTKKHTLIADLRKEGGRGHLCLHFWYLLFLSVIIRLALTL